MLVLSRKQNEQIIIGDVVKITVVDIRLGRVRIAIEAPQSIKILRGELADRDRIQNERIIENGICATDVG